MGQQPDIYYDPPSREEKFAAHLDASIKFHRENKDDPYSIGNAVMISLVEVRAAWAKAYDLPPEGKARSV